MDIKSIQDFNVFLNIILYSVTWHYFVTNYPYKNYDLGLLILYYDCIILILEADLTFIRAVCAGKMTVPY